MKRNEWTLIIGASHNPLRYSYKALVKLTCCGYEVIALGREAGAVNEIPILTGFPQLEDIHTVNLYLAPQNQPVYYQYIVGLNPRRVVFNPGTENPEFEMSLLSKGISVVRDCTFVMLGNNTY